jgi:hypothetical protein
MLAATIRWLAGASIWDVAFMFKISSKTMHTYKWRVIEALNTVLQDNVLFPTSDIGLSSLAQGFADKAGSAPSIPNVVAAVDCVVLEIRAPTVRKDTNISAQYNRKGYFATTVLAFVDSKMRFLSISINCATSSHDSTVFSCSKLGHVLSRSKEDGGIDAKWVIVGDDAFKTLPHVMTPYQKQHATNQQKNFNYCLSKLRSCVECAFGLWKGKWGIFWRPLLVSQRRIPQLVEVTARLHNLCINRYASGDVMSWQ